jgi:hypothetical protein
MPFGLVPPVFLHNSLLSMRVDKIGSPLLPKREYNAKRKWRQPVEWWAWCFYDIRRILMKPAA